MFFLLFVIINLIWCFFFIIFSLILFLVRVCLMVFEIRFFRILFKWMGLKFMKYFLCELENLKVIFCCWYYCWKVVDFCCRKGMRFVCCILRCKMLFLDLVKFSNWLINWRRLLLFFWICVFLKLCFWILFKKLLIMVSGVLNLWVMLVNKVFLVVLIFCVVFSCLDFNRVFWFICRMWCIIKIVRVVILNMVDRWKRLNLLNEMGI